MGEPNQIVRSGSRQHGGSPSWTSVAPIYETRHVILAMGIDFNNDQLPSDQKMPDCLVNRIGSDVKLDAKTGITTYVSDVQRVIFTLKVINTKTTYKKELETEETDAYGNPIGRMVIYDGHARYGRGPCFGAVSTPGDNWGSGTDADTGIFRMAFPFMLIPIEDMREHQYTSTAVLGSEPKPPFKLCHPWVQRVYGDVVKKRVGRLGKDIVQYLSNVNDPDDLVWSYGSRVLLRAGWDDLDGTDLKCRCFCHFGCISLKHNYPIMRKPQWKNWRRTDTDRFAYWMDRESEESTPYWLYHWFTFPEENAFHSWHRSLKYAVKKTNLELTNKGRDYQIV